MPWIIGERIFQAPAKGKGSDRRKTLCRMCKQIIGLKPYVMALREGTEPINEAKDVARIHQECIPDA